MRAPANRNRNPSHSAKRTEFQTAGVLAVGLATLCVSIAPSAVSAGTFYVGSGGFPAGCAFATLAEAIDFTKNNGQDDEVRLTTTATYNEDVIITGTERLTISGGWIGCTANTASGTTPIAGNGAPGAHAPTISSSLDGVGLDPDLTLRMLDISGAGDVALSASAGRIVLEDVRVIGGTTGIALVGDAEIEVDADSRVFGHSNTLSTVGAGVDCRDSGQLDLHGDITDNSSDQGAGIRAEDSCFVELFPGAFISGGTATKGGGVYLDGNAFLGGGGSDTKTFIANNKADEGGGVYVTGNASVSIFNTEVKNNEAVIQGGGVMATNGGSYSMNRATTVPCGGRVRCSVLAENSLTGAGASRGSAAFAAAGGSVTLYQTFVEDNVGASDQGYLLLAADVGSELKLEGVQIWNNKATWLVAASDDATAEAAFVSTARNDWDLGPGFVASIGARGHDGGIVDLYSSIFHDIGSYSGTVNPDCLMTNSTAGLAEPGGAVIADPAFVDAANGDLHLLSSSPAIDFCDDANFSPTRLDIDLEARGNDEPAVHNGGFFDLGVDEFSGLFSSLFSDGFETGNTSRWSSVSP